MSLLDPKLPLSPIRRREPDEQEKQQAWRGGPPKDVLTTAWTRFVPAYLPDPSMVSPEEEVFLNSRYQVHRRRIRARHGGPDLIHLSFKRRDQATLIPWRDKQRLKNELVGPECEAVELF